MHESLKYKVAAFKKKKKKRLYWVREIVVKTFSSGAMLYILKLNASVWCSWEAGFKKNFELV